jgi:signal transduction histidine kinase
MRLADVAAWLPAVAFVLALIGCVALRDLLTGSLPEAQLRAISPIQATRATDTTAQGLTRHGRAAQRCQWLGLACLTLAMASATPPVIWVVEAHIGPGMAWIIGFVFAGLGPLFASQAVIYTVAPSDGRRWAPRLIVANYAAALTCTLLIVLPWFFQPPQPRGRELDGYLIYNQPTIGAFISTLGLTIYMPIGCAIIGVLCWRAARHERDQVVRTSLKLVAAGCAISPAIVLPLAVQSWSWAVGEPLWTQAQATEILAITNTAASILLTLGAAWTPLVHSHHTRSTAFLVPLWRSDVLALRPAWRLLRQLYDGAYEASADMVTASSPADLLEQRTRIANELHDMLVVISQYLSAEGRLQAQTLTGAPVQLPLQHRLMRRLAAWFCPLLTALGGLAPRPATRMWHLLTQTPLSPFAPTDAACARAAIDVMRTSGEPALHPVPILTPTAWSTDELIGYLRLVVHAATEAQVQEAGTGTFVRMARL